MVTHFLQAVCVLNKLECQHFHCICFISKINFQKFIFVCMHVYTMQTYVNLCMGTWKTGPRQLFPLFLCLAFEARYNDKHRDSFLLDWLTSEVLRSTCFPPVRPWPVPGLQTCTILPSFPWAPGVLSQVLMTALNHIPHTDVLWAQNTLYDFLSTIQNFICQM